MFSCSVSLLRSGAALAGQDSCLLLLGVRNESVRRDLQQDRVWASHQGKLFMSSGWVISAPKIKNKKGKNNIKEMFGSKE